MKIAVITGASSGQGREFAAQIAEKYPALDEIWLFARRENELLLTGDKCKGKGRVFPCDLTDKSALENYREILGKEKPEVKILVNAAGFGKFGSTKSIPLTEINDMIELNVKATVNMTLLSLPYMSAGAKIINMSSVSAFTPLPYFNIYAATKAFVLRFSRAVSNELKDSGISVTAVCPYWVDTEFIGVAKDVPEPCAVTNFKAIRAPRVIVEKALCDSENEKSISLYGVAEHACRVFSKLFCDGVQMVFWNIIRN